MAKIEIANFDYVDKDTVIRSKSDKEKYIEFLVNKGTEEFDLFYKILVDLDEAINETATGNEVFSEIKDYLATQLFTIKNVLPYIVAGDYDGMPVSDVMANDEVKTFAVTLRKRFIKSLDNKYNSDYNK